MLPDFSGFGGLSLKNSVWAMYGMIFVWTSLIMAFLLILQGLNKYDALNVLIFQLTSDWFEVVTYACWFVCVVWGFIAISLPVRPRAPKRAAVFFWLFLIFLHAVGHLVFIIMFCKRCHSFFIHCLAGNITKTTLETFTSSFAQKQIVQQALSLAVPVMNMISAPFVFDLLRQVPPLDIIFWLGWNWVIVAFFMGVLPVLSFILTVPVVLGYINAVDHGGNGTERCAPSKIALFYSLDLSDRMDIRRGMRNVESFQYDISTSDEASSGSSGEVRRTSRSNSSSLRSYTGSDYSSEEESKSVVVPKRIPSYKPNRSIAKTFLV